MHDNTVDITEPTITKRLSNADLLLGKNIEPIKRLQVISEDDFEDLVREWATGYLQTTYEKVRRCGGAGDKGRDVIAFVRYGKGKDVIWDNFQCKHYRSAYSPNEAILEIGKLCYYTFVGEYSVPRKYYFVCPQGISTLLGDLIDHPEKLKQRLKKDWDKKCKTKITSTASIELSGDFERYIDNFDFEIFDDVDPQELIEQHSKTRYFYYRFGGIIPPRPPSTTPPDTIADGEILYVSKLLEAYSDHHKKNISKEDLPLYFETYGHFKRQRKHFYEADSLMQFERDILPPGANAFENLKNEIYDGIIDVVESKHEDGFARIKEVTQAARSLQIYSNPLSFTLNGNDLHGICHHLANEDRVKWVRSS